MKVIPTLLLCSFAIALLFPSCKTQNISNIETIEPDIKLGEGHQVLLLDSIQAADAIVEDKTDRFFERVTVTEMGIQMKINTLNTPREECLQDYVAFMRTDVENFNEDEKKLIKDCFAKINKMLLNVNPKLLHQDIILIKTKGNHYGNSVYYTRENKIIIPKNELENFNEKAFIEVMLHEYSHIFNRYNKSVRDDVYKLIGFKEANGPILMPEKIANRKLLNPDGTTNYYIPLLKADGSKVWAYPLIIANEENYLKDKPDFFNYLDFAMYELKPMEDNVYNLIVDDNMKTTIPFDKIPSFFTKIRDNTNYIIHPDEIIADNFIYTVFLLSENVKVKDFSNEGLDLINEIGQILKSVNN